MIQGPESDTTRRIKFNTLEQIIHLAQLSLNIYKLALASVGLCRSKLGSRADRV